MALILSAPWLSPAGAALESPPAISGPTTGCLPGHSPLAMARKEDDVGDKILTWISPALWKRMKGAELTSLGV